VGRMPQFSQLGMEGENGLCRAEGRGETPARGACRGRHKAGKAGVKLDRDKIGSRTARTDQDAVVEHA